MPRVNIGLSDIAFNLVKSIPKANRGQFVTASIEYFMNSVDGQKIIAFLTSQNDQEISSSVGAASPQREEIATDIDNIGIDTSDWSV